MYNDFGFFEADPYLHTMTFSLRDKIISIKKENKMANVEELQDRLDNIIYKLYKINQDEIEQINNMYNDA